MKRTGIGTFFRFSKITLLLLFVLIIEPRILKSLQEREVQTYFYKDDLFISDVKIMEENEDVTFLIEIYNEGSKGSMIIPNVQLELDDRTVFLEQSEVLEQMEASGYSFWESIPPNRRVEVMFHSGNTFDLQEFEASSKKIFSVSKSDAIRQAPFEVK